MMSFSRRCLCPPGNASRRGVAVALISALLAAPACSGPGTKGSSATDGPSSDSEVHTATTEAPGSSTSSASTTMSETSGEEIDCNIPCDSPWIYEGDLVLSWPDVQAGDLECLKEVTGGLQIFNFPGDLPQELLSVERVGFLQMGDFGGESLSGLNCLKEAGGLNLNGGANLTDVSAIENTTFYGDVTLRDCPKLVDASAVKLSPSDKDTSYRIFRNASLVKVPQIQPETNIRYLWIEDNPKLLNIDPIAGGRALPGASIEVRSNDSLAQVGGLTDVLGTMAIVSIRIEELPSLRSLGGLQGVSEVVYIRLHDLPLVDDLSPLGGLTKGYLAYLSALPSVVSLSGFGKNLKIESLSIGDCGEGDGLAISDLSDLDIVSLVELQLANNPSLTQIGDIHPDGLVILRSIANPDLPASEVLSYAAENGVAYACSAPPDDCECIPWI